MRTLHLCVAPTPELLALADGQRHLNHDVVICDPDDAPGGTWNVVHLHGPAHLAHVLTGLRIHRKSFWLSPTGDTSRLVRVLMRYAGGITPEPSMTDGPVIAAINLGVTYESAYRRRSLAYR